MKFKANNWDFGREEWNNYHCKFVLICKSELLTDQWREKKNLIRELCYRGKEKHGEKREVRQLERERSMGKGETRVSDSEGVRREKVKGRDKKW